MSAGLLDLAGSQKPAWADAPDDAHWLVHCVLDGWDWRCCPMEPRGMTLDYVEGRPTMEGE